MFRDVTTVSKFKWKKHLKMVIWSVPDSVSLILSRMKWPGFTALHRARQFQLMRHRTYFKYSCHQLQQRCSPKLKSKKNQISIFKLSSLDLGHVVVVNLRDLFDCLFQVNSLLSCPCHLNGKQQTPDIAIRKNGIYSGKSVHSWSRWPRSDSKVKHHGQNYITLLKICFEWKFTFKNY